MSKKLPYSISAGSMHFIGLQPVQISDQKPSEEHVIVVYSKSFSKPFWHEHKASSL